MLPIWRGIFVTQSVVIGFELGVYSFELLLEIDYLTFTFYMLLSKVMSHTLICFLKQR